MIEKVESNKINILWPIKNFEKYFSAHQFMHKKCHDVHKNVWSLRSKNLSKIMKN